MEADKAHHWRYPQDRHSLQHCGCVGGPMLQTDRTHVFMCILHCIMAIGRLVVQYVENLCDDLDKVLQSGVQTALDAAHTVWLDAGASPDKEEVYRLLQAWEVVRDVACLYATHLAIVAMVDIHELLRSLTRRTTMGHH